MGNQVPPEIDWERARKPVLIGLLLLALLLVLLLSRCDGIRNGAGNAYDWVSGGDEVTETNVDLIVPDDCEILTMEDGVRKVVCEDSECLTEERYTELLCNPPECKKPTPTETVDPPKKPPCTGPNCKKTSCADYAKKTGKPYQCLDPKKYRNYRGNQIKHGLCPGNYKCMIPGKKPGNPPPNPTPEEVGTDPVTFFCEGRDCNTLYLTDADNPNVRILTPGVKRDPNDPRKLILPPGTREVRVEYPSNVPVELYNFEGPDGNWSAQHQNARIVGSEEQTTPEFTVGFTRRGKKRVAKPTDSVKNEDWAYRGEVVPPTKVRVTQDANGGLTFGAED